MKVSGFWVCLFIVGTALTFLNFSNPTIGSWMPDMFLTNSGDSKTMVTVTRKLKEIQISVRGHKKWAHKGDVNLDDYPPVDPAPSSKASIKPGPIQHGTPLMPFIPKPPPPERPI